MSSGNDLMVLLAIADVADDDGLGYPSIHTLSDKARISESTVKRSIKSLIELGELIIEERGGTSQVTEADGTIVTHRWANVYRIKKGKRVPKEKTGGQIEPGEQSREPGAGSKVMNPTRGPQLRPTNDHKQPLEATKTKKERAGSVAKRKMRATSSSSHSLVVELTNRYALSEAQGRQVEGYMGSRGEEYVLDKARLTDSRPRENVARYFLAALKGDFQWPKRSEKPATGALKVDTTQPELAMPPAEEQAKTRAMLAELKEKIGGA